MSDYTDDDTRTIQSIVSTPSTPSSTRKKRTGSISIRTNKSHTAFFFRIDENNSEITYCKICEKNNGTAYPYSRKGGNTSNMIVHLCDKHSITKNNYTEYLDEDKEV